MEKKTKTKRQSRPRFEGQKSRRPFRGWYAPSLEDLLAKDGEIIRPSYLSEPELSFAGRQTCEDPRTGLTAYGPYSKTDATRREQIRVGIVGPAEAVDRANRFLEQLSMPIVQSGDVDAILHPSFPGVNAGEPFQCQFVTQSIWQRTMRPGDVGLVEKHPDFRTRIGLLLGFVVSEIRALCELDSRPDVVVCAMTKSLEELCRTGIAEYDRDQRRSSEADSEGEEDIPAELARSFRRGLKAACLDLVPTQLLWHRTLAGTTGVQDLATRAWNLTVALLYKAGVIPWRLSDVIEGSCFVGISFYHEDESASPFLHTSIAQAFSERGDGFVLRGDQLEWDPQKQKEKAPHLKQEQAKRLLSRVLSAYKQQVGTMPRVVTLHKASRFTPEEQAGFEEALEGIPQYGLLTITRRGLTAFRPGPKPVLRGTIVDFGERLGLVYTTGYIPFLRCYPGFRIPQPLEITENWGSLTLTDAARDILRLTKLNWNAAAFCSRDPITLAFAKRVGDILKMAHGKEPALHYRYYM
ncbi:MAG: argonaute/piwi family protein [Acidobacteriota bacterium]